MAFFRGIFPRVLGIVVCVGIATMGASAGFADDHESLDALGGSWGAGGALVDVDERTGRVGAGFTVASLHGLEGRGGFDLRINYSQEHADVSDASGLGPRWSWGVTRVDILHGYAPGFSRGGWCI